MIRHVSKVKTTKAAGYLRQLCKHFGHKVPAQYDASTGSIDLPMGRCELRAEAGHLTISTQAQNPEDAERLNDVIASHLARFAFREEPEITWSRA